MPVEDRGAGWHRPELRPTAGIERVGRAFPLVSSSMMLTTRGWVDLPRMSAAHRKGETDVSVQHAHH